MDAAYNFPIFSGDDFGSDEQSWQTVNTNNIIIKNSYIWADRIYGSEDEDMDWSNLYKQMFICNTVIDGVMDSKEGTTSMKEGVMAAAKVHRAFIYFVLVNMYAKQYDAATAGTDLGVPLVLSPKFLTDLTRASVQTVYSQIKKDLTDALPALPDRPDFISNPSKAAAYSILARVCLNTREFSEAKRYADLTLSIQNTLLDLNTYKNLSTTPFPLKFQNPEEIFFKRATYFQSSMPISASAIALYDQTNDLRYKIYLTPPPFAGSNFTTGVGYFKHRIVTDGLYVGPNVPEMMLIKAECEARADNSTAATNILNTLRRKRYDATNYNADVAAATGSEALRLVIDERRREFIGKGFRWFDQRRLSKDAGLVPTVTRTFLGETYTLEPGSNRYTYPIADKYITLNPEIIQNPR
ncbi:putative lipoprotein [Pedobacter sp. BAL39]|nr:putative lipoprotein [Pedobacter sp. BAL39]